MATVFFSQALKDQLHQIGDDLFKASNDCANRGHDAATDLFIGPIVSGVWYFFKDRLYDLGMLVNWVWNRLWDLEVYLQNTGNKEWVKDRLTELWSSFASFINDPFGYMRNLLYQKVGDLNKIFEDVPGWFSNWLNQRYNFLYKLSTDSRNTVLTWLNQTFPYLKMNFEHPEWWIKDRVEEPWPWLQGFFGDTDNWLKKRVGGILYVGENFWADPFGYILDQVMTLLDSRISRYSGGIYRTAERLLRYFWEGVWS